MKLRPCASFLLPLPLLLALAPPAGAQHAPVEPAAAPAMAPAPALPPAPPETGAADFDPQSSAWNGTSALVSLLRRGGARVEPADELDWRVARRGAGLVLLDPRQPLEAGELRRLLDEGGRVLLGVERGPARKLLAELGLELELARPPATLTFGGRLELPFALPALEHPVTRGEPFVLANHAVRLVRGGQPLLIYAGPDAGTLLAELPLGKGRLLVLADPSVLINDMLSLPGNRLLAANLGRYLCGELPVAGGRCRLLVLGGSFGQRASWRDDVAALLAKVRQELGRLDGHLAPEAEKLWLLAALLLGACLLQLLLLLPRGQGEGAAARDDLLPWAAAELAPPADLPGQVAALAGAGRGADLRLLQAMLAEQAEPVLRRHLGPGPPARRIAAYLRRHGPPPGGETELAGLLTALAAAPDRDDLHAPPARPCSRAELEDLAARWQALRDRLEAHVRAKGRKSPGR